MTTPMPGLDGAGFFDGPGLHALFYDALYGGVDFGDLPFYEALAAEGGGDILDAACGTGRVFAALASPARRIEAFDASETLLRVAHERIPQGSGTTVNLTRQRLESFCFSSRFDLVLVAYYGFSYLLDAASRAACLRQIALHLKPEGQAVLHLPAPELLSRTVPRHELEAMCSTRVIAGAQGDEVILEQIVRRMDYDPDRALRSVEIEVRVGDRKGRTLRQELATMRYACVERAELEAAARWEGLALVDLRSGFREGVKSELIAILAGP